MLPLDVIGPPSLSATAILTLLVVGLLVVGLLIGLSIRRSLRRDDRAHPDSAEIVLPPSPTLPRQATPAPPGGTQQYNPPGPVPRQPRHPHA